jgi:hypothetical protein
MIICLCIYYPYNKNVWILQLNLKKIGLQLLKEVSEYNCGFWLGGCGSRHVDHSNGQFSARSEASVYHVYI